MADSIELFRQMAEHTLPRCGKSCGNGNPDRCCNDIYCEAAEKLALDHNIVLPKQPHPRLRFMGPVGCVVPPHFRPLCTLHDCKISSIGEDPEDAVWTDRYFELREEINVAVYEEKVAAVPKSDLADE